MDTNEIIKACAGPFINGVFGLLKDKKPSTEQRNAIEVKVINHLVEVYNWSEQIQFVGMHQPQYTDSCTVDLTFDIPRKFRSESISKVQDQSSLLEMTENLIILGDPGSGKTTTLKKIARKILLSDSQNELDTFSFPIVIKLRECDLSLYVTIAKALGLPVEQVEHITEIKRIENGKPIVDKVKNIIAYIGSKTIDVAISEVLNESRALLMLDGFDELNHDLLKEYEIDIQQLASRLTNSRIIMTSRGGYTHSFDRFSILEICGLESYQITDIIQKWAADPSAFMDSLRTAPYYDTANRPLFLTQLINIFNYYGELPQQPADVYEQTMTLLLTRWDRDRKIKRKSMYAHFYPEKKIKFLAAVAYEMTYKQQSKRFSQEDLIRAYNKIHKRFQLPKDEAKLVASEIESHTGIIIESTNRMYEFSHLSLQEYLCALYIVKDPFNFGTLYIDQYPPPVAIAIALSSYPEDTLARLILDNRVYFRLNDKTLDQILSRLVLEQPFYGESQLLGLAILRLLFDKSDSLSNVLSKMLSNQSVLNSVLHILLHFAIISQPVNNKFYFLQRIREPRTKIEDIKHGKVPSDIFDLILQRSNFKLKNLGEYSILVDAEGKQYLPLEEEEL